MTTGTGTTNTDTNTETETETTATTDEGQQGPVGQPGPTESLSDGLTPYTYTTVINGVTTRIADTFTPTSPATVTPVIPSDGTVMDYSSWLSQFGAPAAAATAQGNAALGHGCNGMLGLVISTVLAVSGGVLLVNL